MFCGKCGAKNEPGATFCGSCGAPLTEPGPERRPAAEPTPAAAPVSGQTSGKHKKIGVAVVAAAVVIVLVALFSLLGGRSDTATAEQLVDLMANPSAEGILDLLPEGLLETAMEETGYTRAEVANEFLGVADELRAAMGVLDYLGGDIKLSYKAVGTEDMAPDELSDLKEQYHQMNVDVSAARTVNMEIRVQANEYGLDETIPFEIPVIKVGRSWYLNVAGF